MEISLTRSSQIRERKLKELEDEINIMSEKIDMAIVSSVMFSGKAFMVSVCWPILLPIFLIVSGILPVYYFFVHGFLAEETDYGDSDKIYIATTSFGLRMWYTTIQLASACLMFVMLFIINYIPI